MAYSTLKLYKIDFKPEQLACLDNISEYLDSLTPNTITEFQYVKHNLDIQIKVDLYQSYTNNLTYNYISIKNNIDNRTYYYYITNYEWVSQNAVRLFLSMDDLNTFRDLIVFDDNTKIKRTHKDRFVYDSNYVRGMILNRIIDKFPENLPEMPKFRKTDSSILNNQSKWYLIYTNTTGDNPASSSVNNPIDCFIVPENQISLIIIDPITEEEEVLNVYGIDTVDRTLSYIIKIIECPYCPFQDIQDAYDTGYVVSSYNTYLSPTGYNRLKLANINTEFYNPFYKESIIIPVSTTEDADFDKKLISRESKLYHSDFYTLSFVYDSFVKNIPMENIRFYALNQTLSINNVARFEIVYKQSNGISSSLLFDFQEKLCEWKKITNTENILVCQRNNELPIFNSSYLNYIRNGYNFDVKSKNLKLGESIFSNVVGIAGGVAGLGASAFTGGFTAGAGISLLTSSIKGIASTITGDIQNQYNIDRKIKEARATATGVEGSEDLNLMNYYLGNKLHKMTYSITDEMKTYLYELFYKCGYATNEAGIPNITSRKNFNFLECEAEFTTRDNPEWKAYLEDVYEKFRKGVTFFHVYDDFLQQKENWEVWI